MAIRRQGHIATMKRIDSLTDEQRAIFGEYVRKWKYSKRQRSTSHIKYESGPGPYPVAVVEDDATLCCYVVDVPDVCFAAIPQGATEHVRRD